MFGISLLEEASTGGSSLETGKWLGILMFFFLPVLFAAFTGYIRGKGIATLARNPNMEDVVFKKYMITATICEYSTVFSPILGIFLAILAGGG